MSMPLHVYVGPFASVAALPPEAASALRRDDDFNDQLVFVNSGGGQAWLPNVRGFGAMYAENSGNDAVLRITTMSLTEQIQAFKDRYAKLFQRIAAEHGVEFEVEYGALPYYM